MEGGAECRRVLLDVRHVDTRDVGGALAGHDVSVCHGPDAEGCPLLDGGDCRLYEDATGLVFALDLDVDTNRQILRRYRELSPELPIRVITSPEAAARWADALKGVEVWTREPTSGELAAFSDAVDRFDSARADRST